MPVIWFHILKNTTDFPGLLINIIKSNPFELNRTNRDSLARDAKRHIPQLRFAKMNIAAFLTTNGVNGVVANQRGVGGAFE
jgi:hypothetical protein